MPAEMSVAAQAMVSTTSAHVSPARSANHAIAIALAPKAASGPANQVQVSERNRSNDGSRARMSLVGAPNTTASLRGEMTRISVGNLPTTNGTRMPRNTLSAPQTRKSATPMPSGLSQTNSRSISLPRRAQVCHSPYELAAAKSDDRRDGAEHRSRYAVPRRASADRAGRGVRQPAAERRRRAAAVAEPDAGRGGRADRGLRH